jgi:hypothetical protein
MASESTAFFPEIASSTARMPRYSFFARYDPKLGRINEQMDIGANRDVLQGTTSAARFIAVALAPQKAATGNSRQSSTAIARH